MRCKQGHRTGENLMRRMLPKPMLGAAALMLIGGARMPAAKADLIRTVAFSVIGPGTASVALPQFNPARGTLNSVTISETATDQFVLEIFNSGAGGSFTAMAQNNFSFGLGGPPVQPGFLDTAGSIPAGMPIFTTMAPAVPLGSPMLFFGPGADAFFIGKGTLDTSVSLSAATVSQFSGATVSGLLAFAGASGTVTIDYAFTPVPEPAGFAILSMGVLGLAACRLRPKRQGFSAAGSG